MIGPFGVIEPYIVGVLLQRPLTLSGGAVKQGSPSGTAPPGQIMLQGGGVTDRFSVKVPATLVDQLPTRMKTC